MGEQVFRWYLETAVPLFVFGDKSMPEFNRWDICEAYFAFCQDYHEGQFSEKYARLCSNPWNPGPLWEGYDSLSENAKDIYDALVGQGQ